MLRRRKRPDPEVFASGVLEWLQPLHATALRLTRSRSEAEDLVQDTLVKAFRFSDRFEPGTSLRAWLYTILHNTWRNRRRSAAREAVEVDSTIVEEAAALAGGAEVETPERVLLRSSMDAELQAALDDLPDAFRQAVWLRDVEEFSYAEIAGMLGVPIGTVMSRISRGRRQLYNRLTRPAAVAARRGAEAETGG